MKKPFKVLSTTAMATVFMASAIVPAYAADVPAQKQEISKVIITKDGVNLELTTTEYVEYLLGVDYELADNESLTYIVSSTNKVYSVQDYVEALLDTDYEMTDALQQLEENKLEQTPTVQEGVINEDGQLVAKDGTPSEEAVAVESVKAINDTSIEVTFGKDTEVTAEDLADATITLTAGETTLTATFAKGSFANGKAVFNLADDEKLVDATVYTLASEQLAFAVETYTAKVVNAYAATFATETTAITASTEKELEDGTTRTLKVTAKDQYGEDFAISAESVLSVKGSTLNGMPLIENTEIKIVGDTISITRPLVKGDKLVLKVSSLEGTKVLGTSDIEFTVTEAAEQIPTTVAGVKATVNNQVPTSIIAEDLVTLTPDVRDQNNTTVDADVRYVVTAGADLLSSTEGDLKSNTTIVNKAGSGAVTFKALKPGTVTVDVFNVKNGAKYTYSVEVGAKKLATITSPGNKTAFNNEEIKTDAITATPGAAFTPEMIKFHVTDANGNVTTDATVKAQLKGGTGADKNDIILVAKTTKTGSYKVTPYVGESFTAEGVVKGGVVTITTTLNNIATSIDAVTVPTLKVGTPVKKEIVVRNKHNEDITELVKENVEFAVYKDGSVIDASTAFTYNTKLALEQNTETKKHELTLNAKAEGAYTLRATVKNTAAVTDIAVTAEQTKLASFNLGQDIYDGVIAGDTTPVYQVITAKDNKGDVILPDTTSWKVYNGATLTATSVETSDAVTLAYVKKDKEGKWEVVAQNEAEAVALAIDPTSLTKGTKAYTVTNGEALDATTLIKDSINVTVKDARKLEKLTVEPATVSVGFGATTSVIVKPVDQYGKFIKLTDANTVTGDAFVNVVTNSKLEEAQLVDKDGKTTSDAAKAVGYKFSVTGNAVGDGKVTITDGTVSQTLTVSVAPASQLVKGLTIVGEDAADKAKVENGVAKFQLKGPTGSIKLDAVGLDDNQKEIQVAQSDVIWTSSNPEVATVSTTGVVTAKTVTADTEVTITAKVGTVTKAITFTVSNKESKAFAGTLKPADDTDTKVLDSDKDKDGIQVVLDGTVKDKNPDGEESDGKLNITFSALDQYGEAYSFTEDSNFVAVSSNPGVATVATALPTDTATSTSTVITLTPVKVGESTVTVSLDGQEVVLNVSVLETSPVVVAQKTAVEAAQAAVKAYEDATINTTEAITTAKALKSTAVTEVAKVTDAATKNDLNSRIAAQDAKITKAEADIAAQAAVDAEAVKIKAESLTELVTDANVLTKAQALVAEGFTVTLKSTANSAIATDGKVTQP